MKILIFSDVHGNLPAFEKMLKLEADCEQYISLGDLVNYGPWSNECVELALSLKNNVMIKGNHESYFLDGFYSGENKLVHDFFKFSFQDFKYSFIISTFLEDYKIGKYMCQHTIENKHIFKDTNITFNQNYIIGHSHQQFEIIRNGFQLINPGSVGQNRTYINEINYAILDSETNQIEFKSIVYDLNLILSKMKAQKYPENCLTYYTSKKRK